MIKADELRKLLSYDPETGAFVWIAPRSRQLKPGQRAGCKGKNGYLSIRINDKLMYCHRLAWLYMTGEWPPSQVDHVNGDRSDNRWDNLRNASNDQNQMNCKPKRDRAGHLKGAFFDKSRMRWVSHIRVNGKLMWLGRFNCPTAAHFAYCRAAKAHFGEFARAK